MMDVIKWVTGGDFESKLVIVVVVRRWFSGGIYNAVWKSF